MRFNAGHALNYFNVEPVARLPGVRELHIGHAIVSRAVFVGMREAVREMKRLITDARDDDLRRRHRSHRDPAHRAARSSASASASRGASSASRSSSASARTGSPSPTSPSASPPRRPSPRRSAPGIHAPANWHGVWVVNLKSGKPILEFSRRSEKTAAGTRNPRLAPVAHRRAGHRVGDRDPGMRRLKAAARSGRPGSGGLGADATTTASACCIRRRAG